MIFISIILIPFGWHEILKDNLNQLPPVVQIITTLLLPIFLGSTLVELFIKEDVELLKNYFTTRELRGIQFLRFYIILVILEIPMIVSIYWMGFLGWERYFSMVTPINIVATLLMVVSALRVRDRGRIQTSKSATFPLLSTEPRGALFSLAIVSFWRRERGRLITICIIYLLGIFLFLQIPIEQQTAFHTLNILVLPVFLMISSLDLNRETYLEVTEYIPHRRQLFFVDTLMVWGLYGIHITFYLVISYVKGFFGANWLWLVPGGLLILFYIQLVKFIMIQSRWMRSLFLAISLGVPPLIPIFFIYSLRRVVHGRI